VLFPDICLFSGSYSKVQPVVFVFELTNLINSLK
jgi:hypothetical protein